MRTITCFLLLAIIGLGCKKETNRKALYAYFSYTANGKDINITPGILLNEKLFECRFTSDTALQIIVSKGYNGAGIFIKDPNGIKDGTYLLSNKNNAYYLHPADQKKYVTSAGATGIVTIARGTMQSKDLLKTLQGTFTYTAADTLTGKKFEITNGAFLMEYE